MNKQHWLNLISHDNMAFLLLYDFVCIGIIPEHDATTSYEWRTTYILRVRYDIYFANIEWEADGGYRVLSILRYEYVNKADGGLCVDNCFEYEECNEWDFKILQNFILFSYKKHEIIANFSASAKELLRDPAYDLKED